jgi:hypothetical protein
MQRYAATTSIIPPMPATAGSIILINKMNTQRIAKLRGIQRCYIL